MSDRSQLIEENIFMTQISNFSTQLTSIENYMRLYKIESKWFGKRANVTALVLVTWFFAILATILQYSNGFFSYCARKKNVVRHLPSEIGRILNKISLIFQLTFFSIGFPLIFYAIPLSIALVVHIKIIINAKKMMKKPSFKPNLAYQSDFSLIRCNFFSFLTFVIFWFPFGIVIMISTLTSPKNVSDKMFYYSA